LFPSSAKGWCLFIFHPSIFIHFFHSTGFTAQTNPSQNRKQANAAELEERLIITGQSTFYV